MSEILVEVTRGPMVENIHRGDIAVVGKGGKLKYYKGDPYKVTYIRSALKPVQALNVFLSGANKKYNFKDKEISLICGSHYAQDIHIQTVNKILKKIGATQEDLLCKGSYSLNEDYKTYQISNHIKLTPATSSCSGKHCGMLASCLARGYDIKNYNLINHPIQREIKNLIACFCETDEDKIVIGIDGCGVPAHGIPLYNAALAFSKFACSENLEPELKAACDRIFESMNNAPQMVDGDGGFCTELIKNTNGKLIGKSGADGVYCLAIRSMGIGIAITVEDGSYNEVIPPIVMRCLEDLGVLTAEEIKSLNSVRSGSIKNSLKEETGKINAVFHLDQINE